MKDAETVVMPRLAAEVGAEDPWGEDRDGRGRRDGRTDRGERGRSGVHRVGWRVAPWLVPGLLMGGLSARGVAAPGLWMDELATWGMATSTWRENLSPQRWADVTGTPYHLFMRVWVEYFGASDLSLRAPSMLAMTVAAALVGVLGARLFTPRVGLFAGVIFALLPTSTRYAQEARPYAFALLAAVLATLFLVLAIHRPKHWRFAAYAVAVVLLGLSHVVALVLIAGHGWAVLAFGRKVAYRWAVAASAGVLPVAGLLWLGSRYATRISRFPDAGGQLLAATPRELFGATAIGLVLLGLALFSLPLRYSAAIYTAWAVVPLLVLLLVAQVTPVGLPQSLIFTLPAWATLGAAALGRAPVHLGMVALVAIGLIGLPVQAAFRAPDGHRQATRQLAAIVDSGMRPGDGVVYRSAGGDGSWDGRGVLARYLSDDRQPADLLATGSVRVDGQLPTSECADVARCLGDTRRLWVVRLGTLADPIHDLGDRKEYVLRARYEVAQVWRVTGFTLALLVDERTAL
ncbi:glycosyltransferase family 39 protein [Micromonospora sp. NBC_01796]|uniref:glycosyltransferase family 39 protein n=1 Tax=Micromonospora sp. NBC_01796 TaxID=2975987 RepID=UPI002DDAE263|nr:glycosyltransferase family 39 protein [Micromonospora sp. NBC_01796]WSA84379.1 glycosyltransferase family 39 protein [Micromonospora sp. NBC_01796]